jgi:hypothetical protein
MLDGAVCFDAESNASTNCVELPDSVSAKNPLALTTAWLQGAMQRT